MVQGHSCGSKSNNPLDAFARDHQSKRAGFESMQKREQERKNTQQQQKTSAAEQEKNKYGAWGPVLKNREHFNSLHFS